MDSIIVKVPVTIKAKLTEKLKASILADLEKNIQRVELEIKQINLQEKRTMEEQGTDPQKAASIQQYFGMERQKRLEYRAEALEKQETTQKLAIGAEIVQGTLERQVELKIGDDMREIMNVEVLVEDDKIVAIRS
ncbi:MAG TPA: 16S rRNA processing protein RimM [Selenomonas sp.]|nr:16S rRNA processing protein RimM [Selenomonas sp.]